MTTALMRGCGTSGMWWSGSAASVVIGGVPMKVTYTNDRRDLAGFYINSIFCYRPFLVLFALLYLAGTFANFANIPNDLSIRFKIIWFLCMELFDLLVFLSVFALMIVIASLSRNAKWHLIEHTISVDAGGFVVETRYARTEHRWVGITKVRRSRRCLFVYTSDLGGYPVPRRAFASDDECEAFFSFCDRQSRANAE